MPGLLTSTVRRHHETRVDPQRSEEDALLAAVHFADLAMFPSALPTTSGYEDAELQVLESQLVLKLPAFFDFDAAALQVLIRTASRDADAVCKLIGC